MEGRNQPQDFVYVLINDNAEQTHCKLRFLQTCVYALIPVIC